MAHRGVIGHARTAAASLLACALQPSQTPPLTLMKLLTSLEVSISGFVATAGIATPSRISSGAVSQTPVTGPCASGRLSSQLLQKTRPLAQRASSVQKATACGRYGRQPKARAPSLLYRRTARTAACNRHIR